MRQGVKSGRTKLSLRHRYIRYFGHRCLPHPNSTQGDATINRIYAPTGPRLLPSGVTQGLLISGHMVYLITSLHRVDFGYFGGRASAFEFYAKSFPLPITANLGKSLGKSVFP